MAFVCVVDLFKDQGFLSSLFETNLAFLFGVLFIESWFSDFVYFDWYFVRNPVKAEIRHRLKRINLQVTETKETLEFMWVDNLVDDNNHVIIYYVLTGTGTSCYQACGKLYRLNI